MLSKFRKYESKLLCFKLTDKPKNIYESSSKGYVRSIKYLLSLQNDLRITIMNGCVSSAAIGGHKHLIKYFISLKATNVCDAMCYASMFGHREIIDLFGAQHVNTWGSCEIHAAKGSHVDILNYCDCKSGNNWVNSLWSKNEKIKKNLRTVNGLKKRF